jgi:hypothetical protein
MLRKLYHYQTFIFKEDHLLQSWIYIIVIIDLLSFLNFDYLSCFTVGGDENFEILCVMTA